MNSTATHLPASHVQSLQSIENGYWWFQGRVHWAKSLIHQFQKSQGQRPYELDYIDLGCGTGGFARQIMSEFGIRKAALVDGDPAVLQLANKPGGPGALQINFNAPFTLPFKPTLATCMDVLEHLEDDGAFLKNVADQMAWGGGLVISVPAFPALYSEWDRRLGHHRRYTPDSLTKVIKSAGLTLVSQKFMWSFLMPAAPIRWLQGKRYAESMEFEKVPPLLNRMLIRLSQLEWAFSEYTPLPFGTSLIALTTKK